VALVIDSGGELSVGPTTFDDTAATYLLQLAI
jgi:hypothetical protein